jgi:hypothetical protein
MSPGLYKIADRLVRSFSTRRAEPRLQVAPKDSDETTELRAYVQLSLQNDEYLLPDVLGTLTPQGRRDVFSGPEGSQLALTTSAHLLALGRPDAAYMLGILKRDLGAQPQEAPATQLTRAADSAIKKRLDHATYVLSAEQVTPLLEAGMAANMARGYLLAQELSGAQYLKYGYSLVSVSLQDCLSLLGSRALTYVDFCTHKLPGLTQADAFELLKAGTVSYADFSRHHRISPEAIAPTLAAGVITPKDFLDHTANVDPSLPKWLFEQNLLSFADFLPHLTKIEPYGILRLHSIEPYAGSRPQLWPELLANAALTETDIQRGVEAGYFTTAHCAAAGANQDSLVNALYTRGQISRSLAVNYLVHNWAPQKRFAPALLHTIYDYANTTAIELDLPLPTEPGSQINKIFFTRALGFWFARQDYLSLKNRNLRQVAYEEMNQAEKDALRDNQCMVYDGTFDALDPAFKLEACEHPARMHLECFVADFEANGEDGWLCPDKLCGRRQLTPNEAIDLGLADERVDAVAKKAISAARDADQSWQPCATTDCPSGLHLDVNAEAQLDCRCCGATTHLIRLRPAVGVWSAAEVQLAWSLIESTKEIPKAAGAGRYKTQSVTRECYYCGNGVFRSEGCDLIKCRCGCKFDVNRGPPKHDARGQQYDGLEHTFELRAQRYRPMVDGLLGRMGLYEGMQRGATDQGAYALLSANMAKLEAGETLTDAAA